MQALLQDLRYAIRQLVRGPGLAFTAIISLALGIGATTAVFSVIYAALMNPYPYKAVGSHGWARPEEQNRRRGKSPLERTANTSPAPVLRFRGSRRHG